ncbi:MAG TPA: hypothetical protein VM581_01775 [Magnetospirillaceae bacterium]|nr:hypothetical protein [Magnetospirillaceae bacterium]
MNSIWNFLNSSFFVALLGATGAITAYVIYKRKIKSNKNDAANILLLEIQNAKRQIVVAVKQFKDAGENETKMVAEDTFLMPNESWNKYKYLFVRNFDRDQWDSLSSFYGKCALFDEAVVHNNRAFPQNAEQIRAAMSQAITTVITAFVMGDPHAKPESQAEKAVIEKAEKVHDLILERAGLLFSYSPRKPILDAKTQLEALGAINLDMHILKLKKIAGIKV